MTTTKPTYVSRLGCITLPTCERWQKDCPL